MRGDYYKSSFLEKQMSSSWLKSTLVWYMFFIATNKHKSNVKHKKDPSQLTQGGESKSKAVNSVQDRKGEKHYKLTDKFKVPIHA